jgi:hypothetical protein
MEFLTELWLPIVVSGVVLFVASSIAWTVLPHHQSDFGKAPDEDRLMEALRGMNCPPGSYMFPWCTHAEGGSASFQERYKKGPRGLITFWDMPNMGRNLFLTFLFFLVTSLITAYIAWEAMGALPSAGRFMKAFQITGAIGLLTHASSGVCNAIWFPRRILTTVLDGIAFGILSGLVFGFFWPAATT